jgi:raffinose/stachyose/melibiose transport system substrate-binding protein
MMMKRRGIALLAAITVAVAGLTACSSSGSSGAEDGKSLVIWNYEDSASAMGVGWAKAVQIFKKEHPGVKVTFAKQAFASAKTSAKVLLSGNNVPDVMEFGIGAQNTGQLAALGLLTPLNAEVKKYGWDKVLNTPSLQAYSRYDKNGVAGSGNWWGITDYGSYILWYYNKDYFAKNGLSVPKTQAELDQLMATIKSEGTTPVSAAAQEFPYIHNWFEYVLRDAPKDWQNCYALFKCNVDWSAPYWVKGTQAAMDAVSKGYTSPDITGITHQQMGDNFIAQKSPLMTSGSWWYGTLVSQAKFNWGTFDWPQQNVTQGSTGNQWVVPAHAKNKKLAYDFMDITLRPEVQNLLGKLGGLPVAGDLSTIKDERTKAFTQAFQDYAKNDQFGIYPDGPIPGGLDEFLKLSQKVANRSESAQDIVNEMKTFYESGRKSLLAGN